MKKKNKKNQIRMRLSTILLCILAILLCAAPCGWADGRYSYDGEIYDLDDGEIFDATEDLDWLEVGAGTTVNLRCASVSQYVHAYPGSILNIYSGNVGWFIIIFSSEDKPYAKVTVYGTNFEVDGVPLDSSATQFTVDDSGGVLTGNYGGDGGPILPSSYKPGLWFISSIPIYLMEPAVSEVEIDIDIKPGGNPNNINLKSNGVVPVAVLTTNGFDASTVDPDTVTFAGASPERSTLEDVDEDGDVDMLFHFKTKGLVELDENSTEATLTGETFDGVEIELTDTVRIVQSKKK